MIFQTILMYMVLSSTSLIYGVGIKNLVDSSKKPVYTLVFYNKSLIVVVISTFLTWWLTDILLLPHNLSILFPFFALLITVLFSMLLQHLFFSLFKVDTAEFLVSFFSVLLAISDGTTLAHSFLIGAVAITSFYILVLLLFTIRKRIRMVKASPDFNTGALILLAMACIILASYGWNVSWLNVGVFG